jgi:hypothetical protein
VDNIDTAIQLLKQDRGVSYPVVAPGNKSMQMLKDIGRFIRWANTSPYDIGGNVTDWAMRKGATPGVAAGAGYATNVGLQAIPTLIGGWAASKLEEPSKEVARSLMKSALKPTLAQQESGEAKTAIETLLQEGLNPTQGGADAIRQASRETSKQLADALRGSAAEVEVGKVGMPLTDTMNRAIKQANPLQDIQTVKGVWDEFRNLHPEIAGKESIPVQLAQELKQGTYGKMAEKYGELGSASVEAQKAIARGLKDEIANAVPEAAELNARNSKLLDTLDVVQRRAFMEGNKNPLSLAPLAHGPTGFAAFMADKTALVKALLARAI